MMECRICPRNCGASRELSFGDGWCRMGWEPRIARAALHAWEEPCISGSCGSGTVFFTGCPLRCVYCQNTEISQQDFAGEPASPRRLREIFEHLIEQGAHNINLVNPTHFALAVWECLREWKPVSSFWTGYKRFHNNEGTSLLQWSPCRRSPDIPAHSESYRT